MLGQLIGGFITILVGVTLAPAVATSVEVAKCNDGSIGNTTDTWGECNVTGAAATITGLVTLFFVLAITAVGIAIAVQGLQSAGVM